jgi:hypothetical protein
MKFYITLDTGMQAFYHTVVQDEYGVSVKEISNIVASTSFVQNLFSRESFGNKVFIHKDVREHEGNAWSISEKEFDRIEKLSNLLKSHLEFEKLAKYE